MKMRVIEANAPPRTLAPLAPWHLGPWHLGIQSFVSEILA
jgi:hypothetical protein